MITMTTDNYSIYPNSVQIVGTQKCKNIEYFFLGYTKHKVLGKSPLLFFSQTGPDHIKDGILNYTQMQYETKGAKKPMGVMRLKSLSKKYNCKDVSQSRTVPSTLKYFISF